MTVTKFMKIYGGDRFNLKKKHLREHQLNVTIFSRKFSYQTINNDGNRSFRPKSVLPQVVSPQLRVVSPQLRVVSPQLRVVSP